MLDTHNITEAQAASARFDAAVATAAAEGVKSYPQWRMDMERRSDRLPLWFYDECASRAHYAGYVATAMQWRKDQAAAAVASCGLISQLGQIIHS